MSPGSASNWTAVSLLTANGRVGTAGGWARKLSVLGILLLDTGDVRRPTAHLGRTLSAPFSLTCSAPQALPAAWLPVFTRLPASQLCDQYRPGRLNPPHSRPEPNEPLSLGPLPATGVVSAARPSVTAAPGTLAWAPALWQAAPSMLPTLSSFFGEGYALGRWWCWMHRCLQVGWTWLQKAPWSTELVSGRGAGEGAA